MYHVRTYSSPSSDGAIRSKLKKEQTRNCLANPCVFIHNMNQGLEQNQNAAVITLLLIPIAVSTYMCSSWVKTYTDKPLLSQPNQSKTLPPHSVSDVTANLNVNDSSWHHGITKKEDSRNIDDNIRIQRTHRPNWTTFQLFNYPYSVPFSLLVSQSIRRPLLIDFIGTRFPDGMGLILVQV